MQAVITDVCQITPEWLTKILKEKNCAPWADEISVEEITCTRHSSTWFADIAFLKVSYAGKGAQQAPQQLFLKVSKADLKSADLLYGKREVEFYNLIAKEMPDPPLVNCYAAVYQPESGRSHILLSDLSQTHFQPPSPLPPERPACELAMDAMARIHAHWWEHTRLSKDLRKHSLSKLNSFGLPHSLEETEAMFSKFVDYLGDRFSAAQRQIYERVLTAWPFQILAERLSKHSGITLIHNDAHAWNFLYPVDPEHDRVCMIDWQEWDVNLGTNDLAEMMVLWWYPEHRVRLEEALVRRYHQQLVKHGVKRYEWDHCWNDYRLSALRILLYPVWMYAEGRSPTFWWPILEKSTKAFQDLGCERLLK